MESLELLEKNVNELLIKNQELLQQVDELKKDNEYQRNELIHAYSDIRELKQNLINLNTAHTLLLANEANAEDRVKAKQKITNIILQIDKAIELLSQ
jgi:uncharacterized protein YoxC